MDGGGSAVGRSHVDGRIDGGSNHELGKVSVRGRVARVVHDGGVPSKGFFFRAEILGDT